VKLTLRELFLLVALVAMGCGWWVRERQLAADMKANARWKFRADLLAELWRSVGGEIEWTDEGGEKWSRPEGMPFSKGTSPYPELD
jgi:hypothetical protein